MPTTPRRALDDALRVPDDRRLTKLARRFTVASLIVSGGPIVAWLAGAHGLPSWLLMKANAAFALVTAGMGLWFFLSDDDGATSRRDRRLGLMCASAAGFIALVTFARYGFSAEFNFDELIFQDSSAVSGSALPGRIPLQTTGALVLLSIAVALFGIRHRWRRAISLVTAPTVLIALLSITSYAYDVQPTHDFFGIREISLPAAFCFLFLAGAVLAGQGKEGPLGIFTSATSGGSFARKFFPIAVAAPFLFGWLLVGVQDIGFFGTEFGTAVLVIFTTGAIVMMTWRMAISLRNADIASSSAAAVLAESEHRFRALIEHSADGISMISADGTFQFHSHSAARILGAQSDALRGQSFVCALHPDDQAGAQRDFDALVLQPGASIDTEFRYLHGDGMWHLLSTRMTNRLGDPDVRAVVANYRDITSHRASQEALRLSDERFREMANHIREAFFVVDAETRIPLYISPTWSEIWGRPLAEAYDRDIWMNAIHPADRPAMLRSIERRRNGEATDLVFRVIRPDNSIRWVRGRSFPVRDDTGVVRRWVGVSVDVTELREAEERFMQAQKMEAVGRLAGGVAHDFNNLLTVIISEAEMVIADLPKDSKEIVLLHEIRSAAESATVLTRQLLAFSRKQLVEPTVFQIDEAITQTSKMLRRLIGEDVRLSVTLASNNASVNMDRGQLEQVLTNLAVNARDAMPEGGLLSITTGFADLDEEYVRLHPEAQEGRSVVITVSDTGSGMPPEIVARAFEPFFTTKEHGKGTGLGLATCHGIVAQSGGHIALSSEAGTGTTFCIHLPRTDVPETADALEAGEPPRGEETILLVEDDAGVRRVGARMLRTQGYRVFEAQDAVEAHHTLARDDAHIDLLMTDVVMPGVGGRELAEQVRVARPGVKVLFATGYTDDVMLQHQLIERDIALVHKPYTSLTLATKVRDILDGVSIG